MNNWFTTKQLSKNIWGIGEFKHDEEVISYLIVGNKKGLLIDTGIGKYNIKKIIEKITDKDLIVINTHNHYDHVGGNKYFPKQLFITNKKLIKLEPFNLTVIKTPGHTPDSICLFDKNLGYLFAGDTLYNGPIYLHLKESNIKDYKHSLEKINQLNKINKIFPGHNGFSFNKKNIKMILNHLKDTKGKKIINIKNRLKILLK